MGASEYEWIEFEDVESQVSFDFGEFNDAPASAKEGGVLDRYETMHLALREGSDGYVAIWAGLDADEWDEELSVPENYNNGGFFDGSERDVGSGVAESFFGENVSGYDDLSDDFPEEYLDLIEE